MTIFQSACSSFCYRSAKVMSTIIQLLADGADPNLVVCPQPALYMAILSSSSELVRHLIRSGGDINVKYFDVSLNGQ